MTLKKRYVGSDFDKMLKADILSSPMDKHGGSYKKIFPVDDTFVIVMRNGEVKTMIEVPPKPYDFQYVPVANRIPVDAKTVDATLDYRGGYGSVSKEDTSSGVLTGQRLTAGTYPLIMRGTFADTDIGFTSTTSQAGTASWYGDTPHVISWNGIGSMDGCQNDYRTYLQLPTKKYYTVPGFEATYYHANDRNTSPDSGAHLFGDRSFIGTVADKAPTPAAQRNTALFRDGHLAKQALQPVLSACEVKHTADDGTVSYRFRVLCGRWLPPEEKYTPISGNTDFYFESMTLNGFYLYDEDPTSPSGWTVKVIDIPVLTENPTYSTESFLAQAPHFSPDGTLCAGIIETGYASNPTITYVDSKRVTQAQAWVFKIDCATGVCTLPEAASTYRTQKDDSDPTLMLTQTLTRSQTLAVAPQNGGTLLECKRIETVALVKSRKDSDTTYPTYTEVWREGSGDAGRTTMQAQIMGIFNTMIGPARARFGTAHELVQLVLYVWNMRTLDSVYPNQPFDPAFGYGGSTGYHAIGFGMYLDTGEVYSGVTDPFYELARGVEMFSTTTNTYSRAQTNTTTTTHEIWAGSEKVTDQKIDTVVTAGYEIGFHGSGFYATGYLWETAWGHSIEIYCERSFGPYLLPASSSSGTLNGIRMVAADPRKPAGIVKNLANNNLSYLGVTTPPNGF